MVIHCLKTYYKQVLFVVLILLLGTYIPGRAQSYVGLSVAGHIPMTFDKLPITHTQANYGGEIGFVYEWHKEHFMLQTGLQYALLCLRLSLDAQDIEQDMLDTRGVAFTYRGILKDRTDQMAIGQLAVPLYIGGIWHGFYTLFGAKATINLHAKATQQAQLKTSGDYQGRYYEWFENMPNHGYHDFAPVATSHAMSLSLFNVAIGADIGYAFKLPSYYRQANIIRLGVFAEYGLMDLRAKQTNNTLAARTEPDYSQYMNVKMNHIYMSSDASESDAHLFTCGLRLTILFQVSNAPSKSYPCRCYREW